MRAMALLLWFAFVLGAQQPTFSTSTQLVVETVSVTDKSGAPVNRPHR